MRNDPKFGPCDDVSAERRRLKAVTLQNPKGSKPAILERLHEGILDGTTTQEMIDDAVKIGDLGPMDAMKLESVKNKYDTGSNPTYKAKWNQIRKETKSWFGKDLDSYDSFMSDFISGGEPGESVKDLKNRYQKAVDERTKGGFVKRTFFPKPKNEIEEEKLKSQIGQEAFETMKSYLPKQYAGDVLAEKTELEKQYGADAFEPGKPILNAIQSIIKRNQLPGNEKLMPITKRNIDWIMSKNPNGIWSER